MKKGKILTGILLVSVAALSFVACKKKKTNPSTTRSAITTTRSNTTRSNSTTKANSTTKKTEVIKADSKFYKVGNDGCINVNVKEGKVDSIILLTGALSGTLKPIYKNDKIIAFNYYSFYIENPESICAQFMINNAEDLASCGIETFYDGDDFVIRNAAYVATYKAMNSLYQNEDFKGINDIKVSNKGLISANIDELDEDEYKVTKDGFEFNTESMYGSYKFVVDYTDELNFTVEQYNKYTDSLIKTLKSTKQSNGDVLREEISTTAGISPLTPVPLSAPIGATISPIYLVKNKKALLHFENGLLKSESVLKDDGSVNYVLASYQYNSDSLVKSKSGIRFGDEFTCDYTYKNGNLVQAAYVYAYFTCDYNYDYDSNNRLIENTYYATDGVTEYGESYGYTYDNNNRIATYTTEVTDNGDVYKDLLKLTYTNGFVSKIEKYAVNGTNLVLYSVYEKDYNTDGTVKFESTKYYDSDENVYNSEKKEYIYDEEKNVIGQKKSKFENGRWTLKTVETKNNTSYSESKHVETYRAEGDNDYILSETDETKTYSPYNGNLTYEETIHKTYTSEGTPFLLQTLKWTTEYNGNKTINKNFILKDEDFVLFNCSYVEKDKNDRVVLEYQTSFDMNTLAFKSGTSNDYEYTIEDDYISVKKSIYTHTSYATDYSPSNRVLDRVEKYDIDADGNRIGDLTTLYYDEIDRLAKKEVYNGTYTDTYEYSYDSEYVKEVLTPGMSPDITENYYYKDPTEDNLLETVRIVRQESSDMLYSMVYQYFYAKFNPVIGAKIGEDITYTYENEILTSELKISYIIKSIGDDNQLELDTVGYITIYTYDAYGREIEKAIYKGDLDNLYEKYTYTYDEDTNRKDGLTYEWHSSGIDYTGEGIYQYQDDRNYLMDIKIYKKGETTQFEERAYYYQDGLLTREIHVYETNRSDTLYGTLFEKVVPTDAYDESEYANGKFLIRSSMGFYYDFYGNAVMSYQERYDEEYENDVVIDELDDNTLVSYRNSITYFLDNTDKITYKEVTKYRPDDTKISEKVTENEFDGTDSYAQTYTETNYDEDENIITIIVESYTRDYETNEITYGSKQVTDYTTNPNGDVTNYVYVDGDWILA